MVSDFVPYNWGMLKAFLDGRLFGEQDGDGDPHVLAMHGWARDRRDFDGVLDEFGGIRLDLPGFGSTPAPETPPTPEYVAELVAPLVESLAAPRVVIGHSYGGRVALHLAAAGVGIDHLVLVGTPVLRAASNSRPALSYRLLRKARAAGLIPEATLDKARQKYGSADYRQAAGVMREALVTAVNEDYRAMLSSITCRVSLITGEHDTAAPPSSQFEAAQILPRATVTVLEGAGHLVEQPHKSAVRAVLTSVLTA